MPTAYTLVTGASSGIGEAVCRRLGAERPLILNGRSVERLANVLAASTAAIPHLSWAFDLREVAAIGDSLAGFLKTNNATVDAFVHCAGVVKVLPMRDMDAETVAEVMNVNCLSAVQIARILLRRLLNKGKLTNIVFLSSTYSIRGTKGQAVYSASKGAVDAMMRSLAVELAPDVRVNSIIAGGVPTNMAHSVFHDPELLAKSRSQYLLRLGEVDDVVNAVEFLLSDRASWITGSSLVVDGGMTVR
ncbi:MAG TPA: SDR family oxidoreductase [Thermoanaerobaculia bacterium]|jgi:NAD(P)-dependent dehydrogenase (short-subunit alcohol dehydrogenase family)|nr:SDR family oxidoreductase [Thermoanaerobaculia bacterium]